MKQLMWFKKTLGNACVFYTFFITALYLLGVYVDSHWVPTLHMVLSLLVFSVVLAAANSFLFSNKFVFALRLLIHYIVTTAVFYIAFILWGGFQANGGSVLTALLVYSFAYVICSIIVFMYRYITAGNRVKETEYRSMFDDRQNGGKK